MGVREKLFLFHLAPCLYISVRFRVYKLIRSNFRRIKIISHEQWFRFRTVKLIVQCRSYTYAPPTILCTHTHTLVWHLHTVITRRLQMRLICRGFHALIATPKKGAFVTDEKAPPRVQFGPSSWRICIRVHPPGDASFESCTYRIQISPLTYYIQSPEGRFPPTYVCLQLFRPPPCPSPARHLIK